MIFEHAGQVTLVTKCLNETCAHTSETHTICRACGQCETCAHHDLCETGYLPWPIRYRVLEHLLRLDPHQYSRLHECVRLVNDANDPHPLLETRAAEMVAFSCFDQADMVLRAALTKRPLTYATIVRASYDHSVAITLPHEANASAPIGDYPTHEQALIAIQKRYGHLQSQVVLVPLPVLQTIEDWRQPMSARQQRYWKQFDVLKLDPAVGFVVRTGDPDNHILRVEAVLKERIDLREHSQFPCVRCHKEDGHHDGYSWRFPICVHCQLQLAPLVLFVNPYLPAPLILMRAEQFQAGYVQLACGCAMRSSYEVSLAHLKLAGVTMSCPQHRTQRIIHIQA